MQRDASHNFPLAWGEFLDVRRTKDHFGKLLDFEDLVLHVTLNCDEALGIHIWVSEYLHIASRNGKLEVAIGAFAHTPGRNGRGGDMVVSGRGEQPNPPCVDGDGTPLGVNRAVLSRKRQCREENRDQTMPHTNKASGDCVRTAPVEANW